MNTQKNVNQRLSKLYTQDTKQELSSEKIELSEAKAKALTKDFRKAESGMKAKKQTLDKLLSELKALEKLQLKAKSEYDEAGDFMEIYGQGKDRYNSIYDSMEKKAKEIGVNVDDIPSIKELGKAFDDAADAYRPLSSILSDVRKAIGMCF